MIIFSKSLFRKKVINIFGCGCICRDADADADPDVSNWPQFH